MYIKRLSSSGVKIYSSDAFAKLHKAGQLAAMTLDHIAEQVVAGVSTGELDREIYRFIVGHGATPATLGYKGYTKSSCISINHEICHGIPSDKRLLADGDILNIDVTAILDGWYGDTSRMFVVGSKVSVKGMRLMEVTLECLRRGIAIARAGNTLGDIGATIQEYAHSHRLGVVRDFSGHGIGQVFHDAPSVFHHGVRGTGLVLEAGMVFTIEPMINGGTPDVKMLRDGWTVVTRDRSLSAQYEHTIGVTEGDPVVFTVSSGAVGHEPPMSITQSNYTPPSLLVDTPQV